MIDLDEEYFHDDDEAEPEIKGGPRGFRRVDTTEGTQILWDCGPGCRPHLPEGPTARCAARARTALEALVHEWGARSAESAQGVTDYAE